MKMPPIEKVYEAWSAIADGRVEIIDPDKTKVLSSDGTKTYTVIYNPGDDTYASNDNATFWQGYPGYPVIAAMMVRERLPFDYEYAKNWADVNWNLVNKQHQGNYAAAVDTVARERGINMTEANDRAKLVMNTLSALPIKVKRLKLSSKN